jgi:hypothetical protein
VLQLRNQHLHSALLVIVTATAAATFNALSNANPQTQYTTSSYPTLPVADVARLPAVNGRPGAGCPFLSFGRP